MKSFKVFLMMLMVGIGVEQVAAQATTTSYAKMSSVERAAFVNEQAQRVARGISGREYRFTADFVKVIQANVDSYANRINNPDPEKNAQVVFARGQVHVPAITAAFKTYKVSPLIGLYLPLIESEFNNYQPADPKSAVGMFQFLPQTGQAFGLSTDDLLNVEKSADAAAKYILKSVQLFEHDPMKEALAVLSYNRGANKVLMEVTSIVTLETRACSICALTAAREEMDKTFKEESVNYVPRFFAAAIVGENPGAFGLSMQPLSSYANK